MSTPLIPDSTKATSSDATIKESGTPETKAAFFLFAVAFVVGFSERLAKDTITKLEGGSSEPKEEIKPGNTQFVVVRLSKPASRSGRDR